VWVLISFKKFIYSNCYGTAWDYIRNSCKMMYTCFKTTWRQVNTAWKTVHTTTFLNYLILKHGLYRTSGQKRQGKIDKCAVASTWVKRGCILNWSLPGQVNRRRCTDCSREKFRKFVLVVASGYRAVSYLLQTTARSSLSFVGRDTCSCLRCGKRQRQFSVLIVGRGKEIGCPSSGKRQRQQLSYLLEKAKAVVLVVWRGRGSCPPCGKGQKQLS
jgi:hypothetical protein